MWLPTHPWHSYYYLRKFDVLKSWLSRTRWTSIYSDNSEYLMFLEETLYILLAQVGLWHTTIHRGYIVEKNQHHHPESPEGRKVWLLEKSLPFLFGFPELSDHALVRIQAGSEVHLSTWLGKKKASFKNKNYHFHFLRRTEWKALMCRKKAACKRLTLVQKERCGTDEQGAKSQEARLAWNVAWSSQWASFPLYRLTYHWTVPAEALCLRLLHSCLYQP